MMSKRFRPILVLLLMIMVLAGSMVGMAAPKSKPVNLKMVIWGAPNHIAMYNKLITAYQKTHPLVKVEIIVAPYAEFTEKVSTMIYGGNPPDITWWSEDSLMYFADKDFFLPLDAAVKKWGAKWDLADFWPSTIEGGKWKNKLYGIPFSTPAPVLYYNKKLFDEAGLQYPNDNWTWDDFEAALEKLSKGEGPAKVYGVDNLLDKGYDWQHLLNLIRSYGGKFMNAKRNRCVINSPESVKALKKYREWVNAGYATKPGVVAPFEQGRSAMLVGWLSMKARFDGVKDLNYDIAYVPKGPAGRQLRNGSAYLVVLKSTKYKKESLELLSFLSGKEGIREQSVYFGPPRKSVGLSPEFLNPSTPPANKKVYIDSLQYGKVTEHFPLFAKANPIAQEEIDKMVIGKQSVEATLSNIQNRINKLLSGK